MYVEQLPSGRYRATIRLHGKRHKATFDYRYEAEAWAANAESRIADLAAPAAPQLVATTPAPAALATPPAKVPTVLAHGTEWVNRRAGRLATATLNNYRHHLRYLDAEGLGRVPMNELRRSDVERWQTRMAKADGTGAATLNARLKVLRMIYRDAMAEYPTVIHHDPTHDVKPLPKASKRYRVLTRDEEAKLLLAAGDNRLPMLLALDAGLRWSEAFGLHADAWVPGATEDDPGYVLVRNVNERDSRTIREYTKSHRDRLVPLTTRLADALMPALAAAAAARGPGGLLFASEDGTPVDYFNYRHRVFVPARYAAGIRGLGFHDLRHTYGSRLAAHGMIRAEIAKVMGHADEKTTAIYIHAGDDGLRAAMVRAALG